jgi:hypothetical protein
MKSCLRKSKASGSTKRKIDAIIRRGWRIRRKWWIAQEGRAVS